MLKNKLKSSVYRALYPGLCFVNSKSCPDTRQNSIRRCQYPEYIYRHVDYVSIVCPFRLNINKTGTQKSRNVRGKPRDNANKCNNNHPNEIRHEFLVFRLPRHLFPEEKEPDKQRSCSSQDPACPKQCGIYPPYTR